MDFKKIIPCGIENKKVTNLNEILKQEASKYHLPVSSYVRLLLFKEEKEGIV